MNHLIETVRGALLAAKHFPSICAVPLFIVGAMTATQCFTFTPRALDAAVAASLGLAVAVLAGSRLHRHYDAFGVPCRWCGDLEFESDEEIAR